LFPVAGQATDMLAGSFFVGSGIRCIKVGAYLTSKGFKDVNMLEGGINAYAKWLQANPNVNSKFKGKNFNFDDRIKHNVNPRLSSNTPPPPLYLRMSNSIAPFHAPDDVLGKCHQCGVSNDSHVNCSTCNALFIQVTATIICDTQPEL
jgi:predicted sulfurtransferase